jgi:hypothetical protein
MKNDTTEPKKPGMATGSDDEQLRRRLLSLEREAEWLRSRTRLLGIGLLVTLVLGAVGAFSRGIPGVGGNDGDFEVLTAQRVVLTDAQDQPRGEWKIDEEGNARLGLLDRQGRTRLSLSVLSGGSPGLSLINSNGRRRAALGLLPDESTSLVFADGAGVPRAVLGLSTGDAAQLVFDDAGGVGRVALGLDEAGLGNMILPEDSVPEGNIGGTR